MRFIIKPRKPALLHVKTPPHPTSQPNIYQTSIASFLIACSPCGGGRKSSSWSKWNIQSTAWIGRGVPPHDPRSSGHKGSGRCWQGPARKLSQSPELETALGWPRSSSTSSGKKNEVSECIRSAKFLLSLALASSGSRARFKACAMFRSCLTTSSSAHRLGFLWVPDVFQRASWPTTVPLAGS